MVFSLLTKTLFPPVDLSVIVTCYNIEEYLPACLESVLAQKNIRFELILVDDGSSDQSFEVASQLLKGHKRVKLLRQKNKGAGGARNTGLMQARGTYVCFIDGDDWLYRDNALETLYNKAVATDADLVCSNRIFFKEISQSFKEDDSIFAERTGKANTIPGLLGRIAIHGKLFKRSFLVEHQLSFPEGMSVEDFVFAYSVLKHNPQVTVVPEVTYVWLKRAGENTSLTQARLTAFSLQSRFRQIELTQAIVDEGTLKKLYPHVKFGRIDFQIRLMRHIKWLPTEANAEKQQLAFEMIRDFIKKHAKAIKRHVDPSVQQLYKLFSTSDVQSVTQYIESKYSVTKPQKKNSQLKSKLKRQQVYEKIARLLFRIRQRVQSSQKVRIGFLVSDNTKWNASPLLKAFADYPEFECFLLLTLTGRDKSAENRSNNYLKERSFFSQLPAPLVDLYDPGADKKIDPPEDSLDIVFYQQPWGMGKLIGLLSPHALAVYMPYGYLIYQNYQMEYRKPEFHPYLWRYFSQSEMHKQIHLEQDPIAAEQIFVTGYPKLDVYQQPEPTLLPPWPGKQGAVRIVYAPHHSLPKEPMSISTFHWNYDLLLELAKESQGTSWIYRPHARLKYVVEKNGVMSKEQYFEYEAEWNALHNSCLFAEGEYFDVFKSSDVLITDCSSFLGEYMPTGKPVIWLVSDKPGFDLNPVGKRITDTYYKVHNREELINTFQRVVLHGDDYLKEKRLAVMHEVFSSGFNAAGSIAAHLFEQLFSDTIEVSGPVLETAAEIGKKAVFGILAPDLLNGSDYVELLLEGHCVAKLPIRVNHDTGWADFTIPLSRSLMRFVDNKKVIAVSYNGQLLNILGNSMPVWRKVNRLSAAHLFSLLDQGWYFDDTMLLHAPFPCMSTAGFALHIETQKSSIVSLRVTAPRQTVTPQSIRLLVDGQAVAWALLQVDETGDVAFHFTLNKTLLAELNKRHSLQFTLGDDCFLIPWAAFEQLQAELDEITISKPSVLNALSKQHELNAKGQFQRSACNDALWVDSVFSLYHKARQHMMQLSHYDLYICGSALLGYKSTGKLLSYNKSFDCSYLSKHTEPEKIKAEFKGMVIALLQMGADIRLLTPRNTFRCDYMLWYNANGDSINIFPAAFVDGCYYRPTFVDASLQQEDILPLKTTSMHDFEVLIPANSEIKLAKVYGKNWQYQNSFWQKRLSSNIVAYRKSIMLGKQDFIDIAKHSSLEGEHMLKLINDGQFRYQK